ncbi:MAG TPA: SigE family RNA polymerase sigma factor [Actinomycetota bacterium]|nr:SigE family RNA polymerase sigma factor [Actinomycetota bacterium]
MPGTTIVVNPNEDVGTGADPQPGSLEDLYLRHAPEAVRLAFLLTRDGAIAEDLVQEAFIRVAGRFLHLRSPQAFDAYLRKTVVNLCMTHHRKRKVASAYLDREIGRVGRAEPMSQTADVETRSELRDALETLPDRQRVAVVLRFYLDRSEEETAATLGCSVTAARSLVHRGVQTLRDRLRSEDHDG